MVLTLTAAMLVGTPLTASAADLSEVYSIQKPGLPVDDEHDVNTSGTGTVTNTETGSSILTDNEGKIKGIVLDREIVEAEKGINETLTAEIILDGALDVTSISGNDTDDDKQEEALRRLSEKITWKLGKLNANGEFVQDTSLSSTLGIKIDTENENVDRRKLTLIPKQGTVAGKEIYVQASINSSYFIDKDGVVKKYAQDIGEVKALAKVSIKEYTDKLTWKWEVKDSGVKEPTPYLNHGIDLSKYLVREPVTANDTITWAISFDSKDDNGAATLTQAGLLTIKKAGKNFTVYAMGEKCDRHAWKVATQAGEPATAIELYQIEGDNKAKITKALSVDVGKGGENGRENVGKDIKVEAKLIASKKVVLGTDGQPATTKADADAAKANGKYKVGSKKIAEGDKFIEANKDKTELVTPTGATDPVQTLTITDNVVWDVPAKQAGIAGVTVDPANDRMATITVSKDAQVGSATITAKTPKKSAKATVKVSATLIGLKITNAEKTLYSGQTLQMTYERIPAGNKDSIKWEIAKIDKKADPNASINGKGLLTIKPTVADNAEITVHLKSPKKGDRAELFADPNGYKIKVKQSSIDGITVTENSPVSKMVAGVGVVNNKVTQTKIDPKSNNTTNLDIPMNARYTVDVIPGSNVDSDTFTKDVAVNTLTYKNSKPKVVEITRSEGGKLTIVPKASGTAKITVSGIRATESKGKTTGKAISTSFNIKVSQPVTTVTLNKPEIVLVEKKDKKGTCQNLKISGLKVTFGPKQANKSAEKKVAKWEIQKKGDADWTPIMKKDKYDTSASLTYTLTTPKAGDEYTVKVTTATGLTRTSTVKVVSPVTEVALSKSPVVQSSTTLEYYTDSASKNKQNQTRVEIGKTITVYPAINIGTKNSKIWMPAGASGEVTVSGSNVTYAADEVVTYTVNKKGIVSIDSKTGVIKAMKDGTVKITAKTATGKSTTLTVIVTLPATASSGN